MRNIFYLSFTLITVIHVSSCVFGKKTVNPDPSTDTVNVIKTENFYKNDYRKLVIYCGKDSIFHDTNLGNIRSSNTNSYYCLREKVFNGDTTACKQIAELIPLMYNPFGPFNKNLRGKILFKAVLERLNNFEFVNDTEGELSYLTYYNSYGRILTDMIESIDGMHQYDYLEIHVKEKWTSELRELDIISREYIQAASKIYWELYKEAYDKGLIKLKDFGQE